jgi:hypothetical protein
LEALRPEGYCVLEGVCDGIGDGGADLDPPLGLVELDPQAEGVEGLALDLEGGVTQ